jgi:hypothetical protein
MARMAFSAAQAVPVGEMALLPLATDADEEWSIDREPMGSGWHDSSWMLKKGLDVVELVSPEALPPEWRWRWWLAGGAGRDA